MGRNQVYVKIQGTSMREAFREAQEDAREEHGHEQGYSGEINTSMFDRDMTREYHQAKDKSKFIDTLYERADSSVCGICLKEPKTNTNKVKSKVTITPQKGAKQWETRYVVRYSWNYDENEIASCKTQTEAVKKARESTEKTQKPTTITIEKVLVKGSGIIARIEYKSSTKESKGLYLFVGDARC